MQFTPPHPTFFVNHGRKSPPAPPAPVEQHVTVRPRVDSTLSALSVAETVQAESPEGIHYLQTMHAEVHQLGQRLSATSTELRGTQQNLARRFPAATVQQAPARTQVAPTPILGPHVLFHPPHAARWSTERVADTNNFGQALRSAAGTYNRIVDGIHETALTLRDAGDTFADLPKTDFSKAQDARLEALADKAREHGTGDELVARSGAMFGWTKT